MILNYYYFSFFEITKLNGLVDYCQGTECKQYRITVHAPCLRVQDIWFSLSRGCMAIVVDPGFPSSSGAVIRKQLVVGCILLY